MGGSIVTVLGIFFILKVNGRSSLNSFVQHVLHDFNPYQVIWFTHSETKNFSTDFTAVSSKFPNLKFELHNLRNKELEFLASSTAIKDTVQTSFIIVILNSITQAKIIIDFLARIILALERPKLLCVLPDEHRHFEKSIKSILKYGWEKKFLDFTILLADQGELSFAYYFDPFHYSFHKQAVENETNIFPDKLKNISHYPIILGRGRKLANGSILKNQAAEWARQNIALSFVLTSMNFDRKLVNINDSHYYWWQNNSLWFTNMNANLLGGLIVGRESTAMSIVPMELKCRLVLAAAPILYIQTLSFSIKIIFYIFVIPGTLICLILFTNYLKGKNHLFKIFDVVRLLMGQPIKIFPQTFAQKIVYFSIVLLFVLTTNDLYSEIVEINFDKEEIPIESLEDLDKLQMPIYTTQDDLKILFHFNTDDPVHRSLDNKIDFNSKCVVGLKYKKHVCVFWKYDVEAYIETNRNSDGSAFIKTVEYQCDPLFVQFEPGSPYMKKYAKVNRKIQEAGLLRMVYYLHGFVKKIENIVINEEKDKNLSVQQLIFILTIGYFTAVIVFLTEYYEVAPSLFFIVHNTSKSFAAILFIMKQSKLVLKLRK